MNLKEGTRRLALFLGALGAIAGGILSYVYLQPIERQRELHKTFEQLAASDVVTRQRRIRQAPDPYAGIAKPISDNSRQVSGLPPGAVVKPIPHHGGAPASAGGVDYDALAAKYGGAPKYKVGSKTGEPQIHPSTGEAIVDSGVVLDLNSSIPIPSEPNAGGIATIYWNHDYSVAWIETTNSERLFPTSTPSLWEYLLTALFPVLGFLIPWGAIRAIAWVISGFALSDKPIE